MDTAKRQAITSCGRCGQAEDTHQHKSGTSQADLDLFAALGGPCPKFVASDAAVITMKYLAITDNRAPRRKPGGPIPKRLPLHGTCGHRHQPGQCPIQPGTAPGPDTVQRGAAKAREALARATAPPEES